MIAILGYLEIDIEVSEIGMETAGFGECREISRVDRVANNVLVS